MPIVPILKSVAAALIGGLLGATSCLFTDLLVPKSDDEQVGLRNLVVPFLLGAMFGLTCWRAARAIARRRGDSSA
jgi:hypothetical protein